jgi:fucose 4-O-acetylase-like acetyltransferase
MVSVKGFPVLKPDFPIYGLTILLLESTMYLTLRYVLFFTIQKGWVKMDKERNLMFDVLKGLGIISVIFSHVYRGGKDPLAIFIRELAMWCVPMFFMVQGYFMYSPSYKNWFKSSWKKIKKSYIPYLIWALFYGGFYYYTIGKTFTWLDLILGKTALHLYFMFYYIVFAIFVPLLYFLPQLWRRYILIFMILSNLYVNFMLEISKTYHIHWISWPWPMPPKWWGFLAIGMLLAEYPKIREYITEHARAFAYGALALAAIGLIEPYLNNTVGYLFNKVALFPMAIGVTLFLAIYYSKPNRWGEKFLVYVGQRTFGIYLMHFLFVDYLRLTLIPGDRTLVALIILFLCLGILAMQDKSKQLLQGLRSG